MSMTITDYECDSAEQFIALCNRELIQFPRMSLAQECAKRFGQFVRTQFDPESDESWDTADKLWRSAIMARDVERGQ